MPDVARDAPGRISLRETADSVLKHHRALMSMKENRSVLEHELSRARAGFWPNVNVEGEAGIGRLSDSSSRSMNLDRTWEDLEGISARLVQPIWDGFANRSRVRAAETTLNSVNERVFDTATSLTLDGIIAHVDVLRRMRLLKLAEANVERHRVLLNKTRDRVYMGADIMTDVKQAEARLARAQSSLAEAQNALLTAYATYDRLTGQQPVRGLEEVPPPTPFFSSLADLLALAESSNPKLTAYLQDIRTARANKELVESDLWPHFQLEAGPSYFDRGDSHDRWEYSFDVLVSMRWNIFDSGADKEGIRAASARERQARQTYYDQVDSLRLDMESTWNNWQSAMETERHYSEAVKANQYTCKSYYEQFLMGKRSLLDVLDAENELFNSSSQLETARGNIVIGAYRMLALAGELLPRLGISNEDLKSSPRHAEPLRGEEFEFHWFR